MAGEHRPDHRPVHPDRFLIAYSIATIEEGPWPGRLGFAPAPVGPDDPVAIADWGACVVLGLTTPEEATRLDWPDLASHLRAAGLRWQNAPIRDFEAPDGIFEEAWPALRDGLVARLAAGDRVLVHCRAGRGRSGMIAAALLAAGGMPVDTAVATVRRARAGAIETPAQAAWLRGACRPAGTGQQSDADGRFPPVG